MIDLLKILSDMLNAWCLGRWLGRAVNAATDDEE